MKPLVLSFFTAAPVLGGAVPDKVADRYMPVAFEKQRLEGGILADRMRVNLERRLLKVDEQALVGGFVHRPGNHPWIGEHAGKFLHAAANTYAYTHDARLKALMDRVAVTLINAQLPDGYLGTYADAERWTGWDVWSHKYDLVGLLAWYDVTGDERALTACRKIGDLLAKTFGEGAGQKDISLAGEHLGMAATSVLEPMCALYRHTGEGKYLDFCLYITRSIETRSKVISSLNAGKGVHETANAKAYEMLSTVVGLVELYRLTGEKTFLTPAINAWTDITAHDHLYLTGTTSSHEFFRPPGQLPGGDGDDVGEGCVTVTWLQLNLSLLKLTGEGKYADELERTIYNQLLAAQDPENGDICYFTPMVGSKPYSPKITCCLSSEPRGIALIPQAVWGMAENAIVLNLFAAGGASFDVIGTDGKPVTVKVVSETDFPVSGKVRLTLTPSRPATVAVAVRQPGWCPRISWPGDGVVADGGTYGRHLVELPGEGKTIALEVEIPTSFGRSPMSYPNEYAVVRGPQVLAFDAAVNPECPVPTSVTVEEISSYGIDAKAGTFTFAGYCSKLDGTTGLYRVGESPVKLVPFSEARDPIVWLPGRDRLFTGELPVTFGGRESYSRLGNRTGSITDFRPETLHVTFNHKRESQDWYAVALRRPATVRRVIFRHGRAFHDGGWFDASGGKPEIQIKPAPDADWRTVATLDAYPDTTATDARNLVDGQSFEVAIQQGVQAVAIRVVGRPASGDRPAQSFSSCSELAAYGDEAKP